MKIAFYNTKPYDKLWFEPLGEEYGFQIDFFESPCNSASLALANGHDAICIFVNDKITSAMIYELVAMGVKAILLRCAGYNQVDLNAAKGRIKILRVPSYSPEAVAEFAMTLLLTVNRCTHRAYSRTRDFNMSINGLMGQNLYQKTVGVIGTGKIGQAFMRICKGFGMNILAYDPYPNKDLDVTYVSLEELLKESHIVSLHCPLMDNTKHLINAETIALMRDGVYLINTSRGGLINTEDLIAGLSKRKFNGVALDVYEEEDGLFYEDLSNEIINDEVLVRLASFPNVLITSHMGFFTEEAVHSIAETTLENAKAVDEGLELANEVTA
jgi:Lactate dehydrogenase and related dehydrogenases